MIKSIDRAYAELPPAAENVRDMTPRGTSIANSPRRQVGRSINDPNRTAERLARLARQTGNTEMQMGLMQRADGLEQRGVDRAFHADQAQLARNFAVQRDATHFDQAQQMRGLDRFYQDKVRTEDRQDAIDAEGRRHQRSDFEYNRGRKDGIEDQRMNSYEKIYFEDVPGVGKLPLLQDRRGNLHQMGGGIIKSPVAPPSLEERSRMISQGLANGMENEWNGSEWISRPLRPQKPVDAGSETTTYAIDENTGLRKQTGLQRRVPLGGAAADKSSYYSPQK